MIEDVVKKNIYGLICIDLWERESANQPMPPTFLKWLKLLSNNLSKQQWHSIINASYHTKIDYSDPSIFNTMIAYNWHQFDQEIMLELVRSANCFDLSSDIKKLFNEKSFALYSTKSFLKHHRSLVPHLKRWLIVGAAWPICTHNRDLGIKNLVSCANANNLEFYGTTWGFAKEDNSICNPEDFHQDRQIIWESVTENLYLAKGIKV